MSVLLRTTDDLPGDLAWDSWLSVTGTTGPDRLERSRGLEDTGPRLEAAFEAIRPLWWRLGRKLGGDATATIAVAPTGSVGSDLGVMLAWSHLIQGLARAPGRALVLCDDPWLFRHLALLPGIDAGRKPMLWPARLRLGGRGLMARLKVAATVAIAAIRLHDQRKVSPSGGSALLVYGHPASTPGGGDAYFGDVMRRFPHLTRLLHVDCAAGRALELGSDGRTASLHAWGCPGFAFGLVFARWRPARQRRIGTHGWLVRRAAALENSGGGPAMIRWQIHCQKRWLTATQPAQVVWPWENLAWERALCRAARACGTRTTGYQHTVVGRHQINYSPNSNPDGVRSVPDIVLCNGTAYRDELAAWGVPPERLRVAGALRFAGGAMDRYDPNGPVLIALSSLGHANRALLRVAASLADTGVSVKIKEHPMYPADFPERANLVRTDTGIDRSAGLKAVVFSTGTSGLDALRAGVPAFRLILEDGVAWDVAPAEISIPAMPAGQIIAAVGEAGKPPPLNWDRIFAPVHEDVWRDIFALSATRCPGPAD